MASDIKLNWDNILGECDINFVNNDVEMEGGLETAVLISLFSDRRATNDDPIDDINDRRGWWGDLVSTFTNDMIGSRLWELMRSSTTNETMIRAQQYIEEALQWMIVDGVCANVEVEVGRLVKDNGDNVLGFAVRLFKKDGTNVVYAFDDLWNAQYAVS